MLPIHRSEATKIQNLADERSDDEVKTASIFVNHNVELLQNRATGKKRNLARVYSINIFEVTSHLVEKSIYCNQKYS
jgi:hypothetical protein